MAACFHVVCLAIALQVSVLQTGGEAPPGRQVAQANAGDTAASTGPASENAANTAAGDGAADGGAADESGAEDGGAAKTTKKSKKPAGALETILSGPFIPIAVIVLVGYLLMFRPQQKKQAELNAMLKNLKKGDRVVTVGGIVGVVVNTQKDNEQVTLLTDEGSNTKIRVLRSHVARVLVDGDKGGDKAADKESTKAGESPVSEKSK